MIEDLSHEDYLAIADILPTKMTMNQIEEFANKVSILYLLPIMDARASIFIAMDVVHDVSVRTFEATKKRRINEVIAIRNKNTEECVKG